MERDLCVQRQEGDDMSSLLPIYKKWAITPVNAQGAYLTGANGKEYLDFTSGIGVLNLGHRHPDTMEAVKNQLDLFWHTSNLFHLTIQEEVASLLTELSGLDKVFFANSGTEANEAALKLARKSTGKKKIISCQQSFHGRTFGAMAATGQASVHSGFGPLPEGFEYVPYNDLAALTDKIDRDTAAVMIEVIQGEGGVIPATDTYLRGVDALCKDYQSLLIIDEVQTGMGRTGYPFAFQRTDGLNPDIVTAAKGLGNGLPIGAMLLKNHIAEAFGPGSHGSTFGGNPVSLAAAKIVLEKMTDTAFLAEVHSKTSYFHNLLADWVTSAPIVKQVRGSGLIIGIELMEDATQYILRLQEEGMLVLTAGSAVIRLLPPLIITEAELKHASELLKTVLLTEK